MARSLADFVREALETVEEVSPEGAAQILEKPDRAGWEFIDVREPNEFADGHIPGARNFPRGFLEVRADFEHPKREQIAAGDGFPANPVPRGGVDGLGQARSTRRALTRPLLS